MKKIWLQVILILLGLLIAIPIRFFIMYNILKAIQVDRLVWFLFWIDIPLTLIISVIGKIIEMEGDK